MSDYVMLAVNSQTKENIKRKAKERKENINELVDKLSETLRDNLEDLEALQEQVGFKGSLGEMLSEMIKYFNKTGENPSKLRTQNAYRAIKDLDRHVISFIKTQEQTILKPMQEQLKELYEESLHQIPKNTYEYDVENNIEKRLFISHRSNIALNSKNHILSAKKQILSAKKQIISVEKTDIISEKTDIIS